MTDKDILDFFVTIKGRINSNRIRHLDKYTDYKNYLLTRFCDEADPRVVIWRIYFNQESRNVCPICGEQTRFVSRKYCTDGRVYAKYCSKSCSAKSEERNQKYRETNLSLHGYAYAWQNPVVKNEMNNKAWCVDARNKREQTLIEKYGESILFKTNHYKEKSKHTMLERYGVEHALQNKEIQNKCIRTNQQKYDSNWVVTSDMFKQKSAETTLSHYGVDNYYKSTQNKERSHSITAINKCQNTKRTNHTFNTSKAETKSYEFAKNLFPDAIAQYKSDAYPFACDIYIPSHNLYIECNYHWTHGGHPFNKNDQADIIKVNGWKSHGTKYYDNAVHTWTIRDVIKRETAIKNRLNYKECWSYNELTEFIDSLV